MEERPTYHCRTNARRELDDTLHPAFLHRSLQRMNPCTNSKVKRHLSVLNEYSGITSLHHQRNKIQYPLDLTTKCFLLVERPP